MPSRILSSLSLRSWLRSTRGLVVGLAALPTLALAALAAAAGFPAPPPPQNPAALPGAADAENANATSMPPPGGLLVEVAGAVGHPGLYRVAKGERVSAAIAAAGGFTRAADPDRLPNMAARLKDGEQVKVPSLPVPGHASTTTRSSAGTSTSRVFTVSLNLATAEQLAAVPGFTPDMAAAVIQYRTEYGGFSATRDLVDVLSMSEADYLRARKYLTL